MPQLGMAPVFRLLPRFLWVVMLAGLLNPASGFAAPSQTAMQAMSVHWNRCRQEVIAVTAVDSWRHPASIVVVDPGTGDVLRTRVEGTWLGAAAISDDCAYLYVALPHLRVIRRYYAETLQPDLDIPIGDDPGGRPWEVGALLPLPGSTRSLLVSRCTQHSLCGTGQLSVYDDAVARPVAAEGAGFQYLGRREDTGEWFGQTYWSRLVPLHVDANGVRAGSGALSMAQQLPLSTGGGFVCDKRGRLHDFREGAVIGAPAQSDLRVAAVGHQGSSVLGVYDHYVGGQRFSRLRRISTTSLVSYEVQTIPRDADWAWVQALGADYVAAGGRSHLVIARTGDFQAEPAQQPPLPKLEANGIRRLPITAQDMVYDPKRGLLYASVFAEVGQFGNRVLSVDPSTAQVVGTRPAGSDPGPMALDDGGDRLYVGSRSASWVTELDLTVESPAGHSRFPVYSHPDSPTELRQHWRLLKLHAVRGSPGSVVVLRHLERRDRAITVYDRGVPRPEFLGGLDLGDTLNPGDAPDTLFASVQSTLPARLNRLRVHRDGIRVETSMLGIAGGEGPGVVYAGGRFYSDDGGIWTADPVRLHASFASHGFPLVDLPADRIVHVFSSLSTVYVLQSQISTQRVLAIASLDVGVAASLRSVVWAGPGRIAIAAGNDVLVVPLQVLAPWPEPTIHVTEVMPGLQRHELPVNSLAANSATGRFLVSTGPTEGSYANSVLELNPETGEVERAAFVGSYPTDLSAAPGGQAVFTHLAGAMQVARVRLDAGIRDQQFTVNLRGGPEQYFIWKIAAHPLEPETVAVAVFQGGLAAYRNGELLPAVDLNQDHFSNHAARYQLAFNGTGDRLFGVDQWGGSHFKRTRFSAEGIHAQSLAYGGSPGFGNEIVAAGGLLYTSTGQVVDPDHSRLVGQFTHSELQPPGTQHQNWGRFVHPSPAEGRVYFLTPRRLLVFDMHSYAIVGDWFLMEHPERWRGFARAGNKLAMLSSKGELYIAAISAIPAMEPPLPTRQPQGPETPGVRTLAFAALDLAYDAARNRLLAALPSMQGEHGDRVVAVDLATMRVTPAHAPGPKPEVLALANEDDALYVSYHALNDTWNYRASEVARIRVSDGAVSAPFGERHSLHGGVPWRILQMLPLRGRPGAVLLRYDTQMAGNVWLYIDGVAVGAINPEKYCSTMAASDDPEVVFCYNGDFSSFGLARYRIRGSDAVLEKFSDRVIQEYRVTLHFHEGLLYASSGHILHPDTLEQVGMLPAKGSIAAAGNLLYLLDWQGIDVPFPGSYPIRGTVPLRVVDKNTLQILRTKLIHIGDDRVWRFVYCGEGRVALASGLYVHIVYPGEVPAAPKPQFPTHGVTNAASFVMGASPGGLVTLFGTNLSAVHGVVQAASVPLPRELGGVTVSVGGLRAPLLAVANVGGQEQINFQVPVELRGRASAPIVVANSLASSDPVEVPLAEQHAGVFTVDGGAAAVLHGADYRVVSSADPAAPGEVVLLFATGLGVTSPEPPSGGAAHSSPLSMGEAPAVLVNGQSAEVLFCGLAPGFVGLHQLNIRIPAGTQPGSATVVVRQGNREAPSVTVPVR